MDAVWKVGIYVTRTGAPVLTAPDQTGGSWESRVTGRGMGEHSIPLFGAGIPQDVIREITLGNKYTVVQSWGNHVAYAGVIQHRRYVKATRRLEVSSVELRAAYADSRMLYGVPDYDGDSTVLSVSSKSHSGAARAVIDQAISSLNWELPIDLPADGSGGFSADWKYSERLNFEDHLAQIEDDGCEIMFRPYLDGDGFLRWETLVDEKVSYGDPTDLAVDAPGTRVQALTVDDDFVRQMTGVLGFGKGGAGAPTAWQGNYAVDISVRDVWVSFPDITDQTRLQQAVDALFAVLELKTEQWSFALDVQADGPAFAAPGRIVNLGVYGDPFIPDGKHAKRIVAVRGDMGSTVTPEVQDA